MGLPFPDRVLIELNPFRRNSPENHGPKAPVPDRQGFRPLFSRMGIPQVDRIGVSRERLSRSCSKDREEQGGRSLFRYHYSHYSHIATQIKAV
jgi:hypothetical protein